MAHGEARAWWADVEHLRSDYERTDEARRRADQADLAARRAMRDRRLVEAEVAPRRRDHAEPPPAPPRAHRAALDASTTPGRRTVEIRGRTVPAPPLPRASELDRAVDPPRRGPAHSPVQRLGGRPDRMALWALLMGVMLILVAVGTADAASVGALAGP